MIETFIGFDVGKKRTGVALGNSLTSVARGIDCYNNHNNGATNWCAVEKILKEYNPQQVIVGVPYNADGSTQEMTFIAKSFARKLSEKFTIECVLVDEFLSSNEAKKQLRYNHYHKNSKRSEVDKKSAELILQDFLNNYL